ncbi:phage portal protein, partial [Streptococcus agalactiae]
NMTKLKDAGGFMKQPTETESAEDPPEEEEDA